MRLPAKFHNVFQEQGRMLSSCGLNQVMIKAVLTTQNQRAVSELNAFKIHISNI